MLNLKVGMTYLGEKLNLGMSSDSNDLEKLSWGHNENGKI